MDSAPVLTSNPGDGDQECWDTDNFQSKDYRARVQGELCQRLWRYLESWMGFRERTGMTPGQGRPLHQTPGASLSTLPKETLPVLWCTYVFCWCVML